MPPCVVVSLHRGGSRKEREEEEEEEEGTAIKILCVRDVEDCC